MPDSTNDINPVERLSNSDITVLGLSLITNDPNICDETYVNLLESEAELISRTEFRFLLAEHNESITYYYYFIANSEIGKTHLSQLITEDPERSYASLVAEYSLDRGIPFIAGAVLIHDFLKAEGEFTRYSIKADGSFKTEKWMPQYKAGHPPVNYSKLFKANYNIASGIAEEYLAKTYVDSGKKVEKTAEMLEISKPTAYKKLREIGFDDKKPSNSEAISSILEHRRDRIMPDDKMNESLPVKRKGYSKGEFINMVLDYYEGNGNIEKTAEKYNLPPDVCEEIIDALIRTNGGKSALAFTAADIISKGNPEKAAAMMDMSVSWYLRKRSKLIKSTNKDA